jgi:DNA-binding NarL/FixJ family response regulator
VGESATQVTRILIADKHEVVRSALREMLKAHPDWQVVAEAADGKEAILKTFETKPDIAVIDELLPLVSAVEVTRQIRARMRRTEVLVFAIDDSKARIEALLKAGARGYLTSFDGEDHIVAAVESLAAHKPFFAARVSEVLLESFLAKRHWRTELSNRERLVMQLIAEGHSNRQTAAILDISIRTVHSHRAAVMRKLNLYSSADLVRYAIRNSLLEP